VPEAPELGVLVQHLQHPREGGDDRQPLVDLPRLVEPHADEEHDEAVVDVCRVAPGLDLHDGIVRDDGRHG
jgi:hypothetical protein